MPIYQYSCPQCHHSQEHIHKSSEIISSCPKCANTSYKKELSAPKHFNFNGNGFYETDFKSVSSQQTQPNPCGNNCSCH